MGTDRTPGALPRCPQSATALPGSVRRPRRAAGLLWSPIRTARNCFANLLPPPHGGITCPASPYQAPTAHADLPYRLVRSCTTMMGQPHFKHHVGLRLGRARSTSRTRSRWAGAEPDGPPASAWQYQIRDIGVRGTPGGQTMAQASRLNRLTRCLTSTSGYDGSKNGGRPASEPVLQRLAQFLRKNGGHGIPGAPGHLGATVPKHDLQHDAGGDGGRGQQLDQTSPEGTWSMVNPSPRMSRWANYAGRVVTHHSRHGRLRAGRSATSSGNCPQAQLSGTTRARSSSRAAAAWGQR